MTKPSPHTPHTDSSYGLITTMLGALLVIAVGAVLFVTRPVVVPLIIAWLLFYVLSPVLRFLKRHGVSRALAVVVIILLLLGLFYLSGIFMFQRVNAFVQQYDKYQEQFLALFTTFSARFNVPPGSLGEVNWTKEIGTRLVQFSGSFMSFMGNTVLVLIFLVFLLLSEGQLARKVAYAFPRPRANRISGAIEDITAQIGRYLRIKLLMSLVTGVLVWLVLLLIGVDFPVTWGVLAFFLNFIPSVGSIAASIPPILVALLQYYPGPWHVVGTAAALLAIQISIGNVVEPKLQGDSLNLSPAVILFSLVFWGWLWGIVGMLVSVPIAASIKIVCENVEPLHPISVFMGGKTPAPGPSA